ncbi:DUF4190 domain-containing protein [Candidatus Pacearchaeota archaeon]|nr:DUF4190 domain-containing protein [Candidatus Pacearchaeota archaeon]
MPERKEDLSAPSYIFGIASIVLAFFTPLAGLIFSIIGLKMSKKQNSSLAMKGRKFSQIGLVISILVLIITIVVAIVASTSSGVLGNFPIK